MALLERAARNARTNAATPAAGQPNLSKNTGTGMGTVQASRPASTPATPGVNAAPAGRPPSPASATSPYPPPPSVIGHGTGGGAQTGDRAPGTGTVQSSGLGRLLAPVRPSIPSSAPAPAAQPPAAPLPAAPPPRQFTGVPRSSDLRNLQPGEQAMSPWGPVTMDEKGEPKIGFTPEGEVAYRKAVVVSRKKFGAYPGSNDPSAPHPPVQPGQRTFNPFSGQWLDV